MPASTRSFNHDTITLAGPDRKLSGEFPATAFVINQYSFAPPAVFTTCKPVWCETPTIREQRNLRIGEQFNFADDAITTAMQPCAA